MTKYAPLFLIVFFLGCANDADLLDETIYTQKIVEVEIRIPKPQDPPNPGEVSAPDPAEIVTQLIVFDSELASLFCNENFSGQELGYDMVTETTDSDFRRLSVNDLQGHVNGSYGPSVYRNYVLDGVMESDISPDLTNNLFADFNTLRQLGLTAIIRFSYSPTAKLDYTDQNAGKSNEDMLKERVLANIAQVSSVLKHNADVLTCVQIGFVEN